MGYAAQISVTYCTEYESSHRHMGYVCFDISTYVAEYDP